MAAVNNSTAFTKQLHQAFQTCCFICIAAFNSSNSFRLSDFGKPIVSRCIHERDLELSP